MWPTERGETTVCLICVCVFAPSLFLTDRRSARHNHNISVYDTSVYAFYANGDDLGKIDELGSGVATEGDNDDASDLRSFEREDMWVFVILQITCKVCVLLVCLTCTKGTFWFAGNGISWKLFFKIPPRFPEHASCSYSAERFGTRSRVSFQRIFLRWDKVNFGYYCPSNDVLNSENNPLRLPQQICAGTHREIHSGQINFSRSTYACRVALVCVVWTKAVFLIINRMKKTVYFLTSLWTSGKIQQLLFGVFSKNLET